jgi:uncharacterized protein
MAMVTDRARRLYPALAACVFLLSVWDIVVRPGLPSDLHLVGGLVVAGCTVAFGLWGGLDAEGLGLLPRRFTDGLRYGGLAFGAVTAVVLLGLVIPVTRHEFDSTRADITAGHLLVQVLATIPLGTVVVEELTFRGAVLGLLLLAMPTVWAVVACSVLFGLWHVPAVLGAASGSPDQVLAVAGGTFVATFAASAVLCWLRIRSGSLLAPAMAHLATNTVALIVAWLVVH